MFSIIASITKSHGFNDSMLFEKFILLIISDSFCESIFPLSINFFRVFFKFISAFFNASRLESKIKTWCDSVAANCPMPIPIAPQPIIPIILFSVNIFLINL